MLDVMSKMKMMAMSFLGASFRDDLAAGASVAGTSLVACRFGRLGNAMAEATTMGRDSSDVIRATRMWILLVNCQDGAQGQCNGKRIVQSE
jgi:hypothetical protein